MADVALDVGLTGNERAQQGLDQLGMSIARVEEKLKSLREQGFDETGSTVKAYTDRLASLRAEQERLVNVQQRQTRSNEEVGLSTQSLALAATAAGAAVTALGYAAAYTFSHFMEGFRHTLALGDQLSNLSQQTGLSVEKLSGLQVAARTSNISIEAFGKGIEQFNRHIDMATKGSGAAAEAFTRIGVNIYNSSGQLKDGDTILSEVADRFAQTKDGAEKTAIAIELFSRAGANMIPLLNKGSAGLKELEDAARKAGIVMDKEAVAAAQKFNENMVILKAFGEGFWMAVASPMVDGLAKITQAMREARLAGETWLEALQEGAKKAFQILAGVGSEEQQRAGAIAQLDMLQKRMAGIQAAVAAGDRSRSGQIQSTQAEINFWQSERDRLNAVMAINFGANAQGEFGVTPGSAKADLPPRAPGKETGGERSFDSQVNTGVRYWHDLMEAGELAKEDFIANLDALAAAISDHEELSAKIRAEAKKERDKIANEESKAAINAIKHLESEQADATKRGERDAEISMRARIQIREREVERDLFLTNQEKIDKLQALREELEGYTYIHGVKERIAALDSKIAGLRFAEENKYINDLAKSYQNLYGSLEGLLSRHLAEFIKGHESLTTALKGIFRGFVDAVINEFARLAARAFIEGTGLKDALGKIFRDIGKDVGNIFGDVWSFLKEGFLKLWAWLSGMWATKGATDGAAYSAAFNASASFAGGGMGGMGGMGSLLGMGGNLLVGGAAGGAAGESAAGAGGGGAMAGAGMFAAGAMLVWALGPKIGDWVDKNIFGDKGPNPWETAAFLPQAKSSMRDLESRGLTRPQAAQELMTLWYQQGMGHESLGAAFFRYWGGQDGYPLDTKIKGAGLGTLAYNSPGGRDQIFGFGTGGSFLAVRPQMVMVGEQGAEQVDVTPIAGRRSNRAGNQITFNAPVFMDPYAWKLLKREMAR